MFNVQSGRQQTSVGLLLRPVHLQAWATVGQAIAHATSGSHPNRDPPLLWNDQRRSWHTSVQLLTIPINFCLHKLCSYQRICNAEILLQIRNLNYVNQKHTHSTGRNTDWIMLLNFLHVNIRHWATKQLHRIRFEILLTHIPIPIPNLNTINLHMILYSQTQSCTLIQHMSYLRTERYKKWTKGEMMERDMKNCCVLDYCPFILHKFVGFKSLWWYRHIFQMWGKTKFQ